RVQQAADGFHHFDVLPLGVAADVVDLARAAGLKHAPDRGAVVLDVQPVADVFSVTVHRQRLPGHGFRNDQRNELFRELVRAVVVGAVGGQRRQPVGVLEGADEVVGGGVGGGGGRVGGVGGGFGEQAFVAERAVDRVGGHVQEAEGVLAVAGQLAPVVACALQQRQGADHVGLDEGGRAVDGAVDVAFGGEVEDGVG